MEQYGAHVLMFAVAAVICGWIGWRIIRLEANRAQTLPPEA